MRSSLTVELVGFLSKQPDIITEPQVLGHFKHRDARDVRSALDELVEAGRLLRWERDDGMAGWSTIVSPVSLHRSHWKIVTEPVTQESLQRELLSLEPLSFTEFVEELLRADSGWSDVAWSGRDWAYDLKAIDSSGTDVFFITKRIRTATERAIREAIEKRADIHKRDDRGKVVLVIPGIVTAKAAQMASSTQVDIWDCAELLKRAPPELVELYRAAERREHTRAPKRDRGDELLQALVQSPRGTAGWAEYQGHVQKLVEYLFVPPLGVPFVEIANESRTDRRDIVMANTAESGTWALLRQMYKADYVVIDAKNHDGPLAKRSILEVAHYLKWYGVGLFALVACRQGFANSGRVAAREQWIGSQRMLVPVADQDFTEMVQLKQRRSSPEDVIADTIRKFRISL